MKGCLRVFYLNTICKCVYDVSLLLPNGVWNMFFFFVRKRIIDLAALQKLDE